jgi:hypothetical protein
MKEANKIHNAYRDINISPTLNNNPMLLEISPVSYINEKNGLKMIRSGGYQVEDNNESMRKIDFYPS